MFEKKTRLECLEGLTRSSEFGLWLRDYERCPAGTLFQGPTATERFETEEQAHNQLEAQRGRRIF